MSRDRASASAIVTGRTPLRAPSHKHTPIQITRARVAPLSLSLSNLAPSFPLLQSKNLLALGVSVVLLGCHQVKAEALPWLDGEGHLANQRRERHRSGKGVKEKEALFFVLRFF